MQSILQKSFLHYQLPPTYYAQLFEIGQYNCLQYKICAEPYGGLMPAVKTDFILP